MSEAKRMSDGAIQEIATIPTYYLRAGVLKLRDDLLSHITALEAELAAAQSERLELARIYDPNCDTYDYQTQSEKLNAMASLVDAVQDMSVAIGSDPEGCLCGVPDAVLGELASAKAKNDQLNTEGEVLRQILSHRWELLHDAAAHVPTSTELYRLISVELDSGEVRDMQEPKT